MASQFAAGLFLFSKIELVTLGHLLNKKKRNPKIIYRPAPEKSHQMPDSQQLFLFLTTETKSRLLQIGYTHSCTFSITTGRITGNYCFEG